jgi:DUF917 family protein
MPHRQLKTRIDCEDFVQGCTIMGIGGGGNPEVGLKVLLEALDEGLVLEWIDVDDITDKSWTASVYGMGSTAPMSDETKTEIEKLKLKPIMAGREMEAALKELADFAGVTLSAMVPVELGGSNTPAPLVAATRMNLPVVDADYAGRAVPEEMQGTPYLYHKNSYPCASVDRWGNVCIVKETQGPHLFERVGKMLSVAAYGSCFIASTLLTGKETKEIVIRDTLTYSFELGKSVRTAREKGHDPVEAIVNFTGGWLLFTGEVERKDWKDIGGTMRGMTYIKGTGDWAEHNFRYWFKNENHIGWRDDDPVITSPDLPIVVDIATGEGKINTYIDIGDRVAVIGSKGPEVFRSEQGLSGAGPRYYGFDIDYIPIEERMTDRE